MNTDLRATSRPAQTQLWAQQSWLTPTTLASLQELNEQALLLLSAQCRSGGPQPAFIREVGGAVLALDADSMRRAAASGVLLLDAGFADAERWSKALVGAVSEPPPAGPATFFTVTETAGVVRQVISHAWHLARSEPAAARLLLGLSPATVGVIGGSTLTRLTHLAEAHGQWLRPRWENRPRIWADLLRAAGEGGSGAIERLRVRGLQLLAAEVRQG